MAKVLTVRFLLNDHIKDEDSFANELDEIVADFTAPWKCYHILPVRETTEKAFFVLLDAGV